MLRHWRGVLTIGISDLANVLRVLETFVARPAVIKGLGIPERG